VAATPGLLQLLQESTSAQRVADIGDVEALGGRARAAMLAANPDQAAILGKLNAQANAGLDAGSQLTPDMVAQINASRGDWANRGLGYSGPAALDAATRSAMGGENLLRQRQQFAQSVLGNNQQVVGDQFQQILGRPSGATGQAQSLMGQAGPSLFNPESPLSASITSGNQQMESFYNTNGYAGSPVGQIMSTY
jgi:hypothetical protein